MDSQSKTTSDLVVTRSHGKNNGLFTINKIIGKRTRSGTVQYKVNWEGYPESEDSWEPLSSFETSMSCVDEYEEQIKRDKLSKGRSSKSRKRRGSKNAPLNNKRILIGTTKIRLLNNDEDLQPEPDSEPSSQHHESGQFSGKEKTYYSVQHENDKMIISDCTLEVMDYEIYV